MQQTFQTKPIHRAIARIEGFTVGGTNRPSRNNNPGDIEYGAFAKAHGSTHEEVMPDPKDERFAFFPDVNTGWLALDSLLHTGFYATATVEQAINRYAPPSENNTAGYVHNVCQWVGCRPTDRLASLL